MSKDGVLALNYSPKNVEESFKCIDYTSYAKFTLNLGTLYLLLFKGLHSATLFCY